MVVITRAMSMSGFCPFSKKYFKHPNIICLFDNGQFNKFKELIHEVLGKYLNNDTIELVIKYTNYSKYINRFGHLIYVYWENSDTKLKKRMRILNYSKNKKYENSSESESESQSDSDSENQNIFKY